MTQLVIILLELIVLSLIAYFIIKLIKKNDSRKINIEKSVKEGVKSAIKELETEKEEEEELMESLDRNKPAMGVFSNVSDEERPMDSGGELIPANLSDADKEILRMFYGQ